MQPLFRFDTLKKRCQGFLFMRIRIEPIELLQTATQQFLVIGRDSHGVFIIVNVINQRLNQSGILPIAVGPPLLYKDCLHNDATVFYLSFYLPYLI